MSDGYSDPILRVDYPFLFRKVSFFVSLPPCALYASSWLPSLEFFSTRGGPTVDVLFSMEL